jgi:phenylpropionate dioxygenase-like ring-hydroxylating dioxygenase large terminal subunit
VLSRVCAHRWMEICSGAGTARALQCPYHHWTYNLAGQLRSAPLMADTPGFDKNEVGLTEFRHEVWQGFVYVNLDGGARPAAELWAPLTTHLAPYRLGEWELVSTIDWGECPWDWKVFMDNGECYHHLGIHQRTLEPIFPTRSVKDLPDNGCCTCIVAPRSGSGETPLVLTTTLRAMESVFTRIAPTLLASLGSTLLQRLPRETAARFANLSSDPPMPGLAGDHAESLLLAYPFPNYAIAVLPDSAFWFEVQPIAAGKIELRTHLLLPPHLLGQRGRAARIARKEAEFRVVHHEDIAVCTSVQRGAQAPSSRPGALSRLEAHNRTFAHWYAAAMTRRDQ